MRTLWLLVLFTAAAITGCQKSKSVHAQPAMERSSVAYDLYEEEDARMSGGTFAADDAPPPPPPPPSAPAAEPAPTTPVPAQRMVHYSAWMRLRHPRAPQIVDAVEQLAVEAGGFVEQAGGWQVTVRVPVEAFDATLAQIRELAPVVGRSVSASDVTDAFTAVELRLRTARQTLARLQELLARATDETEKLELLREIQRLTEQIDGMDRQARLLDGLARLSRITVEVDGGDGQVEAGPELAGMGWIRGLSPFAPGPLADGRKLRIAAPTGFVQLDAKGTLDAESADSARLRGARLPNDPQGDTAFWADAIADRLAGEFVDMQRQSAGGFVVLTFVEPADRSWRWSIAVRADGRWLDVVVVTYPSESHEQRHRDAVLAVLGGGAA